ncbi:chromosome-associated kinesin KIF4-like isoform X3 [Xenopus laevis]|uniref:Chromosome-associated kinesin KIF4-like isoform X3 n=1 Tax=Xenopus laevis TaxID=8355 RepID=A0A8J1LPW5_XENLA|nr:chromosome-associated kinesin KIF4-like isoform X3 [Xenopus laevis]
MAEMETEHQSQLMQLEQHHQEKDEEIEKIKELCEKNQQLLQENDMYKQPRGKRRTNAKTSAVILEDLLSESESEEEECDDKNWEPGYNSKQSKKLTSRDEGNREDQSLESENSKIDYPDVTAGGSFFTPPCVTPTKKVLREISDIGQVLSIKLQCKPSTASASASVMESQENQTSILTKKKKVLCNSNTSFFSGCSAITEDK